MGSSPPEVFYFPGFVFFLHKLSGITVTVSNSSSCGAAKMARRSRKGVMQEHIANGMFPQPTSVGARHKFGRNSQCL